jgi:CheY-like chemotaxis protein
MPVMNGLEFYKRLRDVNPEQQKKVFMFTADNVSEVRNMVDNALSPEDYQHLPIFSKFDVIEKIREIIKPFLS